MTDAAKDELRRRLDMLGWRHGQHEVDVPEPLKDSKKLGPKFYLFIPETYGTEETGSPCILFLHGAGERGPDVKRIRKHGIPNVVQKKKDFPFVAVSPQCRSGQLWDPDELKRLIDYVLSQLAIDASRLYVTGLSMGGFGTWAMATAYPDLFAAAIPICGGGDPSKAGRIRDLPIWVFHGDADTTVSIAESQAMVDALRRHEGKVRFTVYPGVKHNCWTKTYNNDDIYTWLLEHKSR